jgi:hypothetical protein
MALHCAITVTATNSHNPSYEIQHFWDGKLLSDSTRIQSDTLTEHDLTDFITLFQNADTAAIRDAVSGLLTKTKSDISTYTKILDYAETHLYTTEATTYNEEYYYIFITEALNDNVLSDIDKIRYKFQKCEIEKNRIGSKGADFVYINSTGDAGTLYQFGDKSDFKLVIFYDPDCTNCAQTIAWLDSDTRIQSLIKSNRLSILAIYPDDDIEQWKAGQKKIPQNWTNGYSPNGILAEDEIYTIRHTPTIYILNSNNIIVAKDIAIPQLDTWLTDVTTE